MSAEMRLPLRRPWWGDRSGGTELGSLDRYGFGDMDSRPCDESRFHMDS